MNHPRPQAHTPSRRFLPALALGLLLAAPAARLAAAAAAEAAAYPSFEAASEQFELVGRIKNGRLTLTLDRWASNEPVAGARIEIDGGGRQWVAEPQPDGSYALDAAPFAAAATYPLTLTVTAGEESDLLAADLVVAGPPAAGPATAGRGGIVLAAALALLAAAGAAITAIRRRRAPGEHA